MKILIVTNLYPPHYLGGYEIRCAQIAEYMRQAGEDVFVLTTSFGLPSRNGNARSAPREIIAGVQVERSLHYRPLSSTPDHLFLLSTAKRQLADARRFVEILDEFQPDMVHWWNMEVVSKTPLMVALSRRIPCVYSLEGFWPIHDYGSLAEKEPAYWTRFWAGEWGPPPIRPFLRPLLRCGLARWERRVQRQGIPTRGLYRLSGHACFVSEFVRCEHERAGLAFSSSEVIYGGVSEEKFFKRRIASDFSSGRLKLLYAGQLNPERGLHTIVEALGLLPPETRARLELIVAQSNPGARPAYEQEINERIRALGLSSTVTFLGKIPHDRMANVYQNAHALVFASTRREGLPLTMTEAMCAGCAVITTGSGGAIELADQADLPIFPKDHPVALSRLLVTLEANRGLVYQVAQRGQEVVLRKFTLQQMMDKFHKMYQAQCGRAPAPLMDHSLRV